jgi:fatty-acyl-CoA synthase
VWFQPAIAVGATCVLQHIWDPGELMQLVETHQVSALMMVPTQLIDLLNHPEFSSERLTSVVRIVHVGAAMPPAVLEQALQTLPWIEFIENYGQSELGSVTIRRGSDLPLKAGSVGTAIEDVEVCVIGADGTPVPSGVTGELCVRGPGTLLEYAGQPAETDALHRFGDGWVATGDLARIDDAGFVTLVDRTRDVIISGGTNIYPTEIENVIHQITGIEECAVFAIPDPRLGEVPAAHVVCQSGTEMTRQRILDFCAARLSAFKVPQVVEMVEALPKSVVGKIRKNILRDRYRT